MRCACRPALFVVLLSGCVSAGAEDGGLDSALDGGSVTDARGWTDAGPIEPTCFAPAASCVGGLFFADCGGSEAPVFACRGGRCRWYSGGCLAGFHASDCPATDLCCHATEDGLWPFEWEPSSPMRAIEMTHDIAAAGWTAIDATSPSQIDVVIDRSIAPPVPPTSTEPTCTPGAPLLHCDYGYVTFGGVTETGVAFVLRFWSGNLVGQVVLVELLPEGASFLARAFVRDFTDAAFEVVTSCEPFHTEIESGTLRLDRTELSHLGEVHGSIELGLTGGHSFAFEF